MSSVESICKQAAELPQDQRFALAQRILSLAEPDPTDSVDSLWDEEIRARIARFDRGEADPRPASDVFAEADQMLGHGA